MFETYLIICMIAAPSLFLGLFWWKLKSRTTKFPLGDDVKARRQAGEHLQRRLAKLNEKLLVYFVVLVLVPMFLPVVVLMVVRPKSLGALVPALVAGGALLAVAMILSLRKCFEVVDEIQNSRLGLFGERVVSDELEVLRDDGYVIFHDLQCQGAAGLFNLDHVVVGRGIVVVVETKTRRKPKGDPAGHKVSYDGQKLNWPTWTSTQEIEQAIGNADWLRKELKERLGIEVRVKAALTFPGWYVKGGPPSAPVLVENPKRLPICLSQRFRSELPDDKIDLIRRHLDAKSRDVTFELM